MPTIDSTVASPEPLHSTERDSERRLGHASIRGIVFLASWLAFVSACKSPPKRRTPRPPDAIVAADTTPTGWDLVISSDPSVFQGQPLEVTITCLNTTASSLFFPLGSIWSTFDVRLLDESGRPVPRTRFGEYVQKGSAGDGAVAPLTIPRAGSFSRKLLLNRLYDMTLPENYKLVLTKQMPNRAGDGLVMLVSNEIVIRIDFFGY